MIKPTRNKRSQAQSRSRKPVDAPDEAVQADGQEELRKKQESGDADQQQQQTEQNVQSDEGSDSADGVESDEA